MRSPGRSGSGAKAAPLVDFYPPVGDHYSYGYPSNTGGCFNWSHTLETRAVRASSGATTIYIYYYEHYSGWANNPNVTWRNHWLADGSNASNSTFTSAPYMHPLGSTWYVSLWKSYNSQPGYHAYGETRMGDPASWDCQATSWGYYGPY